MAGIVDGVGRGIDGLFQHIRHSLDTQTAGDHHHMLCIFREHAGQTLLRLGLVAQIIGPGSTGDGLAQRFCQSQELIQLRLAEGIEFLEAFVAGKDKQVILSLQQSLQLRLGFQPVLRVVFQYLTFQLPCGCLQNCKQALFLGFFVVSAHTTLL